MGSRGWSERHRNRKRKRVGDPEGEKEREGEKRRRREREREGGRRGREGENLDIGDEQEGVGHPDVGELLEVGAQLVLFHR